MDNITQEEKNVVDELRKRTINDMTSKLLEDDSVFYRFAKARDFNLVEAEAMLRKVSIFFAFLHKIQSLLYRYPNIYFERIYMYEIDKKNHFKQIDGMYEQKIPLDWEIFFDSIIEVV
ncbi:hypothetical protein AVEN_82181-1 [Araneus ventricosus]|uniref:CRAL/TRIO N-terminal domain-containing protein n=1 Tax=Araneus ventricosus TaxID=182803 RepID=A0A4Y2TU30_ARAVE|nr:hypothetical protein AVEN_82181-1 [Araneus ventricosus]